ncbi:MAG: hypothetical protein WCG79_10215 [Verrucomicrobiota bacterium]|jgi:hypothetical protein
MKCKCACAGKMVGLLGVAIVIVAVVLKLTAARSAVNLCGIQTCASHLVLGANTLILIALFFRPQGSCGCKSDSDCEKK